MMLEQAIIKTGDTEIPVLALDNPLVWIIVLLGFALGFWYVHRRWGRRKGSGYDAYFAMHDTATNGLARVSGLPDELLNPQRKLNSQLGKVLEETLGFPPYDFGEIVETARNEGLGPFTGIELLQKMSRKEIPQVSNSSKLKFTGKYRIIQHYDGNFYAVETD